jgi:hypothetical protein
MAFYTLTSLVFSPLCSDLSKSFTPGRHGVLVAAPPKPGKKTVSATPPVPANSGDHGSGCPARKSSGGNVSTLEVCRSDVGGMGSQWRHRRNREKKRYRRAPRYHQTPGTTGSGCPARKSRGGNVSTHETYRSDVGGMGSQWRHRRNREKKRYRRAPPVPSNSGDHRKRLSRAQIVWGERFHSRDVPVRRG